MLPKKPDLNFFAVGELSLLLPLEAPLGLPNLDMTSNGLLVGEAPNRDRNPPSPPLELDEAAEEAEILEVGGFRFIFSKILFVLAR